ncbi:MAG: hypothetical protein SRB2_04320 [Desulfobacteraceae bacterium Eth-SRB2]|nr:MAG: hypothetical protein SRB2_04320 [Desulfobacteraceae bacterium Eth-SRB2]
MLLAEQLVNEFKIDISKGQLNNILIENKDRFHKEKDDILSVGLQVSNYINVDDTGAPGIKAKTAIAPILAMNYFPGLKALKEKAALIF